MNEQRQIQIVEEAIKEIAKTIAELRKDQMELECRVDELNRVKFELSKLLPHDKRLEQLFK